MGREENEPFCLTLVLNVFKKKFRFLSTRTSRYLIGSDRFIEMFRVVSFRVLRVFPLEKIKVVSFKRVDGYFPLV